MKELKTYQISLAFAGCFLGAGFISGQELWQFFMSFGYKGIFGLMLALIILYILGVMILRLVQMTGTTEMDKITIGFESPFLENLAALLQCGVLVGITIVMTSGIGTLFFEITGLPSWVMSLVSVSLSGVIVFFGLSALMSIFSFSVPMIVIATMLFALFAVKNGLPTIPPASAERSALLPNWWISAITYAGLNAFGSIGILSPFGAHITGSKKTHIGVFGGILILGTVAASVITLMLTLNSPGNYEMPTLSVAKGFSDTIGALFAVLLFLGMFSCSVSSLVAFDHFMCLQFKNLRKKRVLFIFLTCFCVFICSFVGFSSLIGLVYPVLGYMGFFFLILLTAHFVREVCRQHTF